MKPISKLTTERFWEHFIAKYKMKWVDKRSDWMQGVVGDALEALNIQPAAVFKTDYVTTIPLPTGTIIATPFTPGEPLVIDGEERWSLEAQENVLPHECKHAHDAAVEGSLPYGANYIFRTACRAHSEMRANADMAAYIRARSGRALDAARLADNLRYYGCAQEIDFATTEMTSMLIRVGHGGVDEGPGAECIRWMLEHDPELIAINPFAPSSP